MHPSIGTLRALSAPIPGCQRLRQTLAQVEGVLGLYMCTLPALAAVVAENSVLCVVLCCGATQRAVARTLAVRQASQAERWSETWWESFSFSG